MRCSPIVLSIVALLLTLPGAAAFEGKAAESFTPTDSESAQFGACPARGRVTCVVDGDTIWYRGTKIRIADINTPEVSKPACAAEAALGKRATTRLTVLLNQGPFTLTADPSRDEDYFGRKLRVITRAGRSLGDVLVTEGLAERWRGYRRDWC